MIRAPSNPPHTPPLPAKMAPHTLGPCRRKWLQGRPRPGQGGALALSGAGARGQIRLTACSVCDAVLESAAAALANLAYNADNRKRIAQLTGIEPLVWLVAHSKTEAVLESAAAVPRTLIPAAPSPSPTILLPLTLRYAGARQPGLLQRREPHQGRGDGWCGARLSETNLSLEANASQNELSSQTKTRPPLQGWRHSCSSSRRARTKRCSRAQRSRLPPPACNAPPAVSATVRMEAAELLLERN